MLLKNLKNGEVVVLPDGSRYGLWGDAYLHELHVNMCCVFTCVELREFRDPSTPLHGHETQPYPYS